MMAEGFDSSSEQSFIMYTANASAGTEVTLKNASGNMLLSEVIPCSFSSVVLSTPELQMGETCTISVGGIEEEIVVDNSSSGGFAMTGMFGGRSGGRADRFFGGQPGTGDTGNTNAPPEQPDGGAPMDEMPDDQMPQNDGNGFRGDFVPGGFQGGDMGDMPNMGEMPGGQMPDMDTIPDAPIFGGGNGTAPPDGFQVPEDGPGMQTGEDVRREPSGSEAVSGEAQLPDQPREQNGMGGSRGDGRQFMQWDQNQSGPQDAAASGAPAVSPGALALVGVSILSLLAGIIIAFKVKH